MTLVLSLLTREFVCHVSDRRLTDLATGLPLLSRASKTVVVPQPQFMVSYTGIARLTPRMTMDEWLMRTLWEIREADDYFGALAVAATEAFAKLRIPRKHKRHGFLISGWIGQGRFETDESVQLGFSPDAYCTYVTNTLDLERGIEVDEAADAFVHRTRPLFPHERFSIFAAGAALTQGETADLERDLASALRSAGSRERAAALLMVRFVERVAARDSTVGGGTFVCAIPRAQFPVPGVPGTSGLSVLGMRWGLPDVVHPTFLHLPDGPTDRVESPAIIADPFAGRATVIVRNGNLPTAAGAGEVPEEGEVQLRLIALRSSDEIASLFAGSADT